MDVFWLFVYAFGQDGSRTSEPEGGMIGFYLLCVLGVFGLLALSQKPKS